MFDDSLFLFCWNVWLSILTLDFIIAQLQKRELLGVMIRHWREHFWLQNRTCSRREFWRPEISDYIMVILCNEVVKINMVTLMLIRHTFPYKTLCYASIALWLVGRPTHLSLVGFFFYPRLSEGKLCPSEKLFDLTLFCLFSRVSAYLCFLIISFSFIEVSETTSFSASNCPGGPKGKKYNL